ncbi:MAG: glutamyl-tRNA reductase [Magnetococcales bacterium]|nr:glutamyl-tRNA reductase [Magnetococcales bacterium]
MKLAVVGLNHKSAPVALRERLSFPAAVIPEALSRLTGLVPVREAAILSTCNRVELYLASPEPEDAVSTAIQWMASSREVNYHQLAPHLYQRLDLEAVRHGFRVASSLDSLVVGEPQILGQMKEAFQLASAARSTGLILTRYFHRAFEVAKRVRTETAIAENPVSVAYAAVELARKIFGKLEGQVCLLVGAGEMCELAARHMVGAGIQSILATNRTFSRAQDLAGQFDGHAFPLETLGENLDRADIVISSTGSTSYMIDAAMVRAALKRRRQRPMFFIDIAVPRDIDPQVAQVDSAFLYDIDDLTQIVEHNRRERDQAATQAEGIVSREAPLFLNWVKSLEAGPTIASLRRWAEEVRDQETARILAGWPGLEESERRRVEELARLLVNKLMHPPVSRLKELASEPEGGRYVDATRRLFLLDEPTNGTGGGA